jgi:hypothetical protein
MDATGENTKAKALDVAMNHYLADLANRECVADDLPGEHAEALSTLWLPIDRETRADRSDD